MGSLPAVLSAVGFMTGGIAIRRAATWKAERTGWLILILSLGLLLSFAART